MRLRRVLAIWALLASASGIACGPAFRSPTFKNAQDVAQHLNRNEPEFMRFAEDWAKQPDAQRFCYFSDGEYRWNGYFIDAVGSAFKVRTGTQSKTTFPSLADAASRAGTTATDLTSWINRAKSLKIYCVDSTWRNGIVEIMLEGSEWMPYGMRYAPLDKAAAYDELIFYSSENAPLKGRWFYFEEHR